MEKILGKGRDFYRTFIALALFSYRNFTIINFFFANNQHIRNMFQLIVANFLSNLLISIVDSGADIALCQFQTDFVGIVVEFLANRENYRLLRSQP